MAEPDPHHVATAKQQVYAQFPELRGVEPAIATRSVPETTEQIFYLLTFQRQVTLPDGGCLTRLVRVTMRQNGDLVKITSSK